MSAHPTKNERGFTLMELCIGLTLLSIALLAVGASVMAGRQTYQQGMAAGEVEVQVRRTIDRIVAELAAAGRGSLTPPPVSLVGNPTLEFRTNQGYAAGLVQWGNVERLSMQYAPGEIDDGVDNNSNGLVDECRVVLTRDVGLATEIDLPIGGPVREFLQGESDDGADENGNGLTDEPGLTFTLDNEVLTVRLTLEAIETGGAIITRSVETAIQMRN